MLINLLSKSNQNGAPSEAASAVTSQPSIVLRRKSLLIHPMGKPRFPIASAAVVSCVWASSCATFVWTNAWAASFSESRKGEFIPERFLAIRTLSMFATTTIKRAKTSCTACVFRLYQPATRSMLLLNQISSSVLKCSISCPASSRSTLNVICRAAGSFSIPAFKSARVFAVPFAGETISSNARTKVRDGI